MAVAPQADWIWLPGFQDHDQKFPGTFVSFRKSLELSYAPETPCKLHVTADTRYRLFVNGKRVAFGPCKSYPTRWYYETVDVASFLKKGTNVIAAQVLRFFPDQVGSSSLMRTNIPGFKLWGDINGTQIMTNEDWLCYEDRSVRLQPRSEWNYILGPPFMSLDERVDLSQANLNWRDESADVSNWSKAVKAMASIKMMPALEPWKLFERPIPMLPETPKAFYGVLKCDFQGSSKSSGTPSLENWNDLIQRGLAVEIQAQDTVTVEFESSVLTTGFLEFDFVGGKDAQISILYAESYEKDLGVETSPFPRPRSKGDRRDWQHGRLYGNQDFVTLSAPEGEKTRYEPFWFRTFRFIRLSITSKETPVKIERIAYRETQYPLEITTNLNLTSGLKSIWEICVNTLKNCMHETYEDCPFYEQNQFAMDGRLQLLFTYQLSRDDRLARKTIHEFYASRREDGLLETNFPVSFRAINIPQFSLFWVLMLHDHMRYFGDAGMVRKYIGTADGILDHFETRINQDGLVGSFDPECWAFIDWVKEWQPKSFTDIRDMAVPPIYKATGVAAYNSLLFAWTLQHDADLCDFIKRPGAGVQHRKLADSLNDAVKRTCWNGTFFTDGPGTTDISEHTQIFAVLSGAVTGDDAVQLMRRTMSEEHSMPRCSYAMKHYVFRALAKTGLYDEYFARMMRPWEEMVRNNLTTCAEDDVSFRSDCHGWSASPIYELVAEVYGIRPGSPGFKNVNVQPRRTLLGDGQAKFRLPHGELSVKWEGDGDVEVLGGGGEVNVVVRSA